MKLCKTTIVIWSDVDVRNVGIDVLAREAVKGESFCSRRRDKWVEDPTGDPDAPDMSFFENPFAGEQLELDLKEG